MVAKITTPKSIEAALNYNEKKVQKGNAVCLHAANYLKEARQMNFYQKILGFERLNSLNERATTKTLHVSLNFDPSEKLPENKLLQIASDYMQKIGFGEQPYLVYKHEDAGHPHIHIVSTTIKQDGSRINTHNIGRNQSEKARKEIEKSYGLVKAERQQQLLKPDIKKVEAERVIYGKDETKRSISNVVGAVFSSYKFCSLPEFNAALKQFNVNADRGKEEGRIYKNRGLVYRVLDGTGNKVGVPIKA
ncbi:MAG: relaxase/mobilization nuclease domain-containing protein, partial [Chitinophagaceae bacterium]|nr:relaxase/mobilization nuclease domain-containing protein [Chitinophagaceae bacterium]